jgi:hypothetical protein
MSIHVYIFRDESRSISSHNCMFVWLEKLFNDSILKNITLEGGWLQNILMTLFVYILFYKFFINFNILTNLKIFTIKN